MSEYNPRDHEYDPRRHDSDASQDNGNPVGSTSRGFKFDEGKPDWTLMPFDSLEAVVRVLEFGAGKYDRNNWQLVKRPRRRYAAAALRHIFAALRGEDTDPESGLSHWAHACCCIIFILHFEQTGEPDESGT